MGNVQIQTVLLRRLSHYYYVEFIIVQRNDCTDVEIISQKTVLCILSKELFSFLSLLNHTLSKWASNFHFVFNIAEKSQSTFEAPVFSLASFESQIRLFEIFILFEHTRINTHSICAETRLHAHRLF